MKQKFIGQINKELTAVVDNHVMGFTSNFAFQVQVYNTLAFAQNEPLTNLWEAAINLDMENGDNKYQSAILDIIRSVTIFPKND